MGKKKKLPYCPGVCEDEEQLRCFIRRLQTHNCFCFVLFLFLSLSSLHHATI